MTDEYLDEDQAIAAVARLTRVQLVSFVEAEIIVPVTTEAGPAYRKIDIMRLELLCELSDQFDLQDDALSVVMSLVDQLHGVRAELRAVLNAVETEQSEVRRRIGKLLYQARSAR
ncbi:MAG: chaperone modulatory protein CbpM [Paracoccaceae bacterium]|jgi:chaperone modulatory protein CbpM